MDHDLDAPPDNCGVEFDEKCFGDNMPPLSSELAEEEGECDEGDEMCWARIKGLNKSPETDVSSTPPRPRGPSIYRSSIKKTISEVRRSTLATPSGFLNPDLLPRPPFEGLPNDYYKKKYRPDYPSELQMTMECLLKPTQKQSSGTARTHPKAVFKPSLSKLTHTGRSIDPALAAILNEPSPLEMNRLPPPIVSSSDELIVDWLTDHNVQIMLEYFLGLCVIHRPDDPWLFISQLCAKMIEARTSVEAFDALPRLLTPEHTEAIFRIYDRIENGFINLAQYKSAMEAMGLSRFSLNPEGAPQNQISKDTFVKEATEAINQSLRSFMVFEEDPDAEGKSSRRSSRQKSVDSAAQRRSIAEEEEEEEEEEALSASESEYTSSEEEEEDEEGTGKGKDEVRTKPSPPQLETQRSSKAQVVEAGGEEEEGEEDYEYEEEAQSYEEGEAEAEETFG